MAFARTLPAERKDMIKQKIAGEQSNIAALNKDEHDARTAARSVLLEEPFDKDKFKAALDKAVDADAQAKHARMALLASATSDLTPAERKQLHDWIEKHRPLPPLREGAARQAPNQTSRSAERRLGSASSSAAPCPWLALRALLKKSV